MNQRFRFALTGLTLATAVATVSDRALADAPVTLTLSQTSFSVNVAWDGTVTGSRMITASVSHSDSGVFCDKISEVDVQIVNAAGVGDVTLGSYVLPNPLCSFNNTDVSMQIQPFTDAEMVNQCGPSPGSRLSTSRTIGAAIQRSGFSMTQWNAGIRDSRSISMTINCAAAPSASAPPTAATAVQGPSATTVGTPPVVSSSGASDPKNTNTIPPTYTLNPAVMNKTMGQVRATKQPNVTIDPGAILLTQIVSVPATDKAGLDAAKAQLDADYTRYATAAQAYSQSYGVCMNKSYSFQETINAGCTDTDSQMACMRKLFVKCIAPAQTTLNAARTPLKNDAVKAAAFATALGAI